MLSFGSTSQVPPAAKSFTGIPRPLPAILLAAIFTLAGSPAGAELLFPAPLSFDVGHGPYSVALGDLNGDGAPDQVVANHGSNTVSVLLGNGDETFATKQDYATGDGPV